MLEFYDISLSIAGRKILKNVSFSIAEGEFVVLLGENGAGKTTLLRTVFRLIKPEHGLIKIAGQAISSLSQHEIGERLSYVPQSLQNTVNLRCDLFFKDIYEHHSKDVFNDLDVKKFLNRDFHSLSGGERQKVLLASALCSNPKLLLLDELTQYADHATTLFLGEYLKSYCATHGVTVLAVSHDMAWVRKFAERALILKDSELTCFDLEGIKLNSIFGERVYQDADVS